MHIDHFLYNEEKDDMVDPERRTSLEQVEFGMGVVVDERLEELLWRDAIVRKRRNTYLINRLNDQRQNNLNLLNSAEILGLHRKLHQSASHALSTLQVPTYHRFDKPYWQVPYSDTAGVVFTKHLTDTLQIWSGPLARVDLATRALIVDMAMQSYAAELLRTERIATTQIEAEVPKAKAARRHKLINQRKQHLDAQLLLAMMHSFRDEYVVALAFARPPGQEQTYLVGSIGAVRGYTDRLVSETIGRDGSQLDLHASTDVHLASSLPTNTALRYTLSERGQKLADVPERSVAEITRLNVVAKEVCSELGIAHRQLVSQALMYLIHEAVAANFTGVEWEIFNTQLALHRAIHQLGLPAEIISQRSSEQPTPAVAESIHGHYFKRTVPVPQIVALEQVLAVTKGYYG